MPLNKREKRILADAIEHLTDKTKMAGSVQRALLDDAALYIRSWVLPSLTAIRDDDKRAITRLAQYR